jgi:hypothetical protein
MFGSKNKATINYIFDKICSTEMCLAEIKLTLNSIESRVDKLEDSMQYSEKRNSERFQTVSFWNDKVRDDLDVLSKRLSINLSSDIKSLEPTK